MTNEIIDLRSDTLTLPTQEMRKAMADAEVGDDVYGEDPTVNLLQEKMATLLGKENALFVPSGTMANQLALGSQTTPGDEFILHPSYHIYRWEGGAPSALWGLSPKLLKGNKGILSLEEIQKSVSPDDSHYPCTKLISLENTLNRMGGQIYPLDEIIKISKWAKTQGILLHLDGARLWNAHIATDIPLNQWAENFDTVSLCFSKGLGAPVGSILAGPTPTIKKAHRLRKLLGGGMRQAGVVAKAALFALENHLPRLEEDHKMAKLLGEAISSSKNFELEFPVSTNLVWFKIKEGSALGPDKWKAEMEEHGLYLSYLGENLFRAVPNLNCQINHIEKAIKLILKVQN